MNRVRTQRRDDAGDGPGEGAGGDDPGPAAARRGGARGYPPTVPLKLCGLVRELEPARPPRPLRMTVEARDHALEVSVSILTAAQWRALPDRDGPGEYRLHEPTGLYCRVTERPIIDNFPPDRAD